MPLLEAVDNVDETAEALAMRLFEFGLKKFEIELTEATLRRGSRGPEVQALQQQLGITADGIYGPKYRSSSKSISTTCRYPSRWHCRRANTVGTGSRRFSEKCRCSTCINSTIYSR